MSGQKALLSFHTSASMNPKSWQAFSTVVKLEEVEGA